MFPTSRAKRIGIGMSLPNAKSWIVPSCDRGPRSEQGLRVWVGHELPLSPAICRSKPKFLENQPFRRLRNDGFVQMPVLLPRLLVPVVKAECIVVIHVRARRELNLRLDDSHLG